MIYNATALRLTGWVMSSNATIMQSLRDWRRFAPFRAPCTVYRALNDYFNVFALICRGSFVDISDICRKFA
jgi:hypothetical protein